MKRFATSIFCVALGLALAPSAAAQQSRVLKMQSSWPASLTLQEWDAF